MASNNGRLEPAADPSQNLMQAYGVGLDTASKSFTPAIKCAAQVNLEVMGLWNRRVQAYLEASTRLTQMRTPQDFFAEQMRFWQTAMTQYQDSSRKVVQLCAQVVPQMPFAVPGQSKTVRDYFTFPEPQDAPRTDANGRRAA